MVSAADTVGDIALTTGENHGLFGAGVRVMGRAGPVFSWEGAGDGFGPGLEILVSVFRSFEQPERINSPIKASAVNIFRFRFMRCRFISVLIVYVIANYYMNTT
jgi:hypothetical protein